MKKVKKVLEFVAVILAIVISALIVQNVRVESILRGKVDPVSKSMTESGLQEEFIGKPAGDDIPRVTSLEDWENTWQTSCVTVEPTEVIATGIGVRHPWVDPYTRTRRGGTQRKADVTNMVLDIFGEYGEYYIVKLPDGAAILAQISGDAAKSVKAGRTAALPVGKKGAVNRQAFFQASELCSQYNVSIEEGLYYCIDDAWGESHNFLVQMTRLGVLALLTIVLGTIFLMILGKVFKEKA